MSWEIKELQGNICAGNFFSEISMILERWEQYFSKTIKALKRSCIAYGKVGSLKFKRAFGGLVVSLVKKLSKNMFVL